jgi:hypothetical protein
MRKNGQLYIHTDSTILVITLRYCANAPENLSDATISETEATLTALSYKSLYLVCCTVTKLQKKAPSVEAIFLQHIKEQDARKVSSAFCLMKITACGFPGVAALIAIHPHVKLMKKVRRNT